MHRVGIAESVVQNLLIALSSESAQLEIGEEVIDESLTHIGRIVDIFGPVSRPYVAITPHSDLPLGRYLGAKLYAR